MWLRDMTYMAIHVCTRDINKPLEPLGILWLRWGRALLSPLIFFITYVILKGLEIKLCVMDTCEVTCVCWLSWETSPSGAVTVA